MLLFLINWMKIRFFYFIYVNLLVHFLDSLNHKLMSPIIHFSWILDIFSNLQFWSSHFETKRNLRLLKNLKSDLANCKKFSESELQKLLIKKNQNLIIWLMEKFIIWDFYKAFYLGKHCYMSFSLTKIIRIWACDWWKIIHSHTESEL